MKQKTPSFSKRVNFLACCILLWSGAIVYRLVDLQILQNDSMRKKTDTLHYNSEPISARRGEIRDRNGKIIAISREEPLIVADPSRVKDPVAAAKSLAKALKKKKSWTKRITARLSKKEKYFCYIERRVSEQTVERIRALNIPGVFIQKENWRTYPNGWIASHAVGFINQDGTVSEGLEQFYDHSFRGKPGKREVMRDGRGRKIGLEGNVLKAPVIGADLELTIDMNIQLFVEDALRRALKKTRAKNLTAIVIDPRSGAILAMANIPDFDPNRFHAFSSFQRKNRAVVDVYEPASAFKIVTVAAALDAGTISPEAVFDCEWGGIQVFDRYIRDNKKFGALTVSQILWSSSNVGAIKIAHTMTPKTFYNYISAFGFGAKTGIDLPAESNGILAPYTEWTRVSSSYLAMGHEISATPLQMLTAAAVIANGGLLVKPFIAAEIVHVNGMRKNLTPDIQPRRVIKEETASLMKGILLGVVEKGTAKAAQIPGVSVFGKTGTAQRIDSGAYSREKFNASFVGFFPAEQPRYGIIVVVHDPKGKVHGGEVAAPIFSSIGQQIVQYERARIPEQTMIVSRRTPDWSPGNPDITLSDRSMPNLLGLGLRNATQNCRALGLKLEIKGKGRVFRQDPAPGAPVPGNGVCKVVLKEEG